MTPVTVRDATPSDAARIAAVARASWTETYHEIFDASFIDDFVAAVIGGGATPDCDLTLRRELGAIDA